MKYSIDKKFVTGAAIPVSSIRSEKSCGIGEFTDLKLFGDWCKNSGLDLIQLLPVNDTGSESSPYSALSAFALHPIYIRISSLPESKLYKKDMEKISKKWNSKPSVNFNGILKDKMSLLKKIYKENIETIKKSKKIKTWEKNNRWIKCYAVFSFLKEKNKNISWEDWKKFQNPTSKDMEKLYVDNQDKVLFYSWVQYYLEKQLTEASKYLQEIGINLKGDIPILMNVDSADVWESREIFNTTNRAGAPPDMFSANGQNWGFPTYSWKSMEKDNYKWWKDRLKQAAKFYHVYRIDHVLGFFRIWTIPEQYNSGSMGYYSPNNFLSLEDLTNIGIDGSRLTWLTKPHVPGHELRESLGLESNEAIKHMLSQIGAEDLYLFNDEITSENDIYNLECISDEAKDKMSHFFRNITLIKIDSNNYIPTWFYYNSRAYHTLSDFEKHLLGELLNSKTNSSMDLWKIQGSKLLKFMKESENMLVCAEDLGTIPQCVPEVLTELGILGLHVTRWSKRYNDYGEPFMKPEEYNYLSVSTPAVHDSTTVRQWWTEFNKDEISGALNLSERLGDEATPEQISKMYEALLKTTSQIAMFQFQDLLALDGKLRRKDMDKERINVPGTVTEYNWSYRMDFTIEELILNSSFTNKVQELLSKRG
ncbi:MAG: 4-alpha-glucanotransferase [Spirochaetaceae bacterium]